MSEIRRRSCPCVRRSRWEEEIDQLVALHQLYGLTEDEVKVVEGVNK
jgi:hypothetical protein